MKIQDQIAGFIAGQPEPKRAELQELHDRILRLIPGCRLWFDDGIGPDGKATNNPTIGYGFQVLRYADGKTKDFFQIGLSVNKTGFSVYILGLKDRNALAERFGDKIGKAKVTGYCIRFKSLKEIDLNILDAAVLMGTDPYK